MGRSFKLVVGGLLLAVGWMLAQSYYDGRCYAEHMSGARITPLGVYCYQNLGEGRSDFFYRLDDLEAATPVPFPSQPPNTENG